MRALVVIRSRRGYEAIKKAILSSYLEFEKLPLPIYAVQYITLFGKALKVIVKSCRQNHVSSPDITATIYELDYLIGGKPARKNLWNLLQLYIKIESLILKPMIFLDHIIKTRPHRNSIEDF